MPTRRRAKPRRPPAAPGAVAVFQAVADPTRRAILDRLRAGPLTAGTIAKAFPVSRPAISRHLRVLTAARLVQHERQGRLRVFMLTPQPLRSIEVWLTAYRVAWGAHLMDLKTLAESLERRTAGDTNP